MAGTAPDVTFELCVDWDMVDWADVPDFSQAYDNITADVQAVYIRRGKEAEEGNAPAGTLDIQIKPGMTSKYSPVNTTGPLYNKLLPWRIVRFRCYFAGAWYNKYFGFISKIRLDPKLDSQGIYIYCTDGLDLLARQMISQNYNDRTRMSDGQAVSNILDAAGWSGFRRDIDIDGGDALLDYPTVYQF